MPDALTRIRVQVDLYKKMSRKAIPLNPEFTVRQWDVDGFPDYFFGHDKQLYRFDSHGCVRRNKRVLIGTTHGYILKRKFYSLKQLRPLLRRHDASTDYPADF